jgi:hypothetical protein
MECQEKNTSIRRLDDNGDFHWWNALLKNLFLFKDEIYFIGLAPAWRPRKAGFEVHTCALTKFLKRVFTNLNKNRLSIFLIN